MRNRLMFVLSGAAVGLLAGLLVWWLTGRNHLVWISTLTLWGSIGGKWLGQRRGKLPSDEERYKPITLFPREK